MDGWIDAIPVCSASSYWQCYCLLLSPLLRAHRAQLAYSEESSSATRRCGSAIRFPSTYSRQPWKLRREPRLCIRLFLPVFLHTYRRALLSLLCASSFPSATTIATAFLDIDLRDLPLPSACLGSAPRIRACRGQAPLQGGWISASLRSRQLERAQDPTPGSEGWFNRAS